MISVYGGTGFVGKKFCDQFPEGDIYLVPRGLRRPAVPSDILYLISTTHNYHVFDEPSLDVETNLLVLTEVLESWKNYNPTGTFNFVSSWFVYGDTLNIPTKESTPCNPLGFYSITKRCAEQLIVSYAKTFNLNYRILRLGNVLGSTDTSVSAKKNALQYMIDKMKNNEDIAIYGDGVFHRNYMHVDDTVRAIKLIMECGELNTIYNVGNKHNSIFIDILNYVRTVLNYTGSFNHIEQKEFHKKIQTKSFQMDCTKLYDLGFKNVYTINQMLDALL
jgi:nucleoside-diphosphate-sugar epimerase